MLGNNSSSEASHQVLDEFKSAFLGGSHFLGWSVASESADLQFSNIRKQHYDKRYQLQTFCTITQKDEVCVCRTRAARLLSFCLKVPELIDHLSYEAFPI